MNERDWLTERFEENRSRLRAVAYRMLGSVADADDAVQEAWIRLHRSHTQEVENLSGWLTTIVGRVCLDMLRSRRSRQEEPLETHPPENDAGAPESIDPEQQALLTDSVGLALLVVLETLDPAERLAFVLHDMFAVPFDEIAPIVDRTPAAARQLASRARRRLQGGRAAPDTDVAAKRKVVEAFLAAARGGDFEALLSVLDPDVTSRSDAEPGRPGPPAVVRGAQVVARGALTYGPFAKSAQTVLVNGSPGVVAAREDGFRVLAFTIVDGRITEIDAITDSQRLQQLELAELPA